jgi:hypothetical protein
VRVDRVWPQHWDDLPVEDVRKRAMSDVVREACAVVVVVEEVMVDVWWW